MGLHSTITLNNGVAMPRFGLGVWQAKNGEETEHAVRWALEAGYRLIDTAAIYGNEDSVGKAVLESGIDRKEIFITTKLWNEDHADPVKAFETSRKKLGLSYIDLYLIHWPVPERENTWHILETQVLGEKCRAIGVSNFTIPHLTSLLKHANTVPAVNQVEFSPFLYQKELLAYCNDHHIVLEAYSPLTRGRRLDNRTIEALAEKYHKTAAEIMIRWALQHNIVVIPKSVHHDRIKENANVFDFSLAPEDMTALDNLNENARMAWNPEDMP